jgi:hypothetical protein
MSADLSHGQRGMGIRFVNLNDDQRKRVNDLYEQGMKEAVEDD